MGSQKKIWEYSSKNVDKERFLEQIAGTFQPNKEEPIHRWYNYITGFSTNLIQIALDVNGIKAGMKVFEPFTGVGSTQIVCKQQKINSIGVDINPFITFIAETKLNWSLDFKEISKYITIINSQYTEKAIEEYDLPEKEPNKTLEFAFSQKIKRKLYLLRDIISQIEDLSYKNFFNLCLVSIIKPFSNYEGFHPYLKKREKKLNDGPVYETFRKKLDLMINDLRYIKKKYNFYGESEVYCKDVRDLSNFEEESFNFVITSPPYLNNWDYSWITRLELYFMKYAKNSKEIQQILSNKLIKASTYNIKKEKKEINIKDNEIKSEIQKIFEDLNSKILDKNRQKRYDYLVINYFNDIYRVFNELYRVLDDQAAIWWVVGDSGHYGIHIPTDILTSKIAQSIGFIEEGIKILRERTASRHKLKLREVILMLRK